MKGLFLGKNTFELKSKTTWEQKLWYFYFQTTKT